jgi:hypothetical protein
MASSDTPSGTRATLDAMSLVEDITRIAQYCEGMDDVELDAAARRVLAAHRNGGLPRALAGGILAGAERRLTALIQTEIEALVKAEGSGG